MAGSEQIQAARRQFEEVWSKGTLEVVDEIMSDDFVRHGPDLEGGQISGREGFKGLVTLFRPLRCTFTNAFRGASMLTDRRDPTLHASHRGVHVCSTRRLCSSRRRLRRGGLSFENADNIFQR